MQHALITGASSGLGAEFARRIAQQNTHHLILVARRASRLEALRAELEPSFPGDIQVFPADLSEHEHRLRLLDWLESRSIDVSLLINNAGFGSFGTLHTAEGDAQLRMVRLNCEAVVHLTMAISQGMISRQSGEIIIVSSLAAFTALPRMATYAATKAFDLQLALALSRELAASNIWVTALCPGPTPTEFGQIAGVEEAYSHIPSLTTAEVVDAALRGLARRSALVMPGLSNRLLSALARLLPPAAAARAADFVLRSSARA